MQIPALRYFLAVARLGSIRQAAEELHVATSAIRRQIANLEDTYGTPLLERHAQGVRLTLAGEIFAQHARSTLHAFERVRSDIDDVRGLKRGHVRIAVIEGIVSNFLLPALVAFSEHYPAITFEIDVAGTQSILGAVARDDADFGIVFNPSPHPEIEIGTAIRHPLVALAPRDHPIARLSRVRLHDLCGHRIALPHHAFGTRQLVESALVVSGLHLGTFLTINSIELLKVFVSHGLGVTILPLIALAHDPRSGSWRAVHIDDPVLGASQLALCFHRHRPPGAAAATLRVFLETEFTAFFGSDGSA
jgi:DNA-binding transcriptional LysR family regulator